MEEKNKEIVSIDNQLDMLRAIIMVACERGSSPDVLCHIIKLNDLAGQDEEGETALHKAVQPSLSNTRLEALEILIQAGANTNAQTQFKQTPLMFCSTYGNHEAAEILLENGADADVRDFRGKTAADIARDTAFPKSGFVTWPTRIRGASKILELLKKK